MPSAQAQGWQWPRGTDRRGQSQQQDQRQRNDGYGQVDRNGNIDHNRDGIDDRYQTNRDPRIDRNGNSIATGMASTIATRITAIQELTVTATSIATGMASTIATRTTAILESTVTEMALMTVMKTTAATETTIAMGMVVMATATTGTIMARCKRAIVMDWIEARKTLAAAEHRPRIIRSIFATVAQHIVKVSAADTLKATVNMAIAGN
ncbi:MAG: hypothetical protein IPO77_11515 [Acidobacteria bacterium]|nr:hypothetical protein [Acidobacteriota bacterium]